MQTQPILKGGHTRLEERGVEIEPSPRWVRVIFNGETIADSKRVRILREVGLVPTYYFPQEDVRMDLMTPTERHTQCGYKGQASYWTLKVGERVTENAVWGYPEPLPLAEDIRGHVGFYWNKMDKWYEEDEEVFVHPRDPYKRVDALPSSRRIQVVVGGEPVADSRRAHLLFETGMPTRYYIPRDDVRMDVLEPTDSSTRCPYKGLASYWRPKVGDTGRDIAWSYLDPIADCPKIKGLICFFNERVDAISVDGEPQPRPQTRWA
jgi:uncharacterized protein (DUF427 family)